MEKSPSDEKELEYRIFAAGTKIEMEDLVEGYEAQAELSEIDRVQAEFAEKYGLGFFGAAATGFGRVHAMHEAYEKLLEKNKELERVIAEKEKNWLKLAYRYDWIISWLQQQQLLCAKECKPSLNDPHGFYWVLLEPAVTRLGSSYTFAKSEDELIDKAMVAHPFPYEDE